MKFIEPRDNSGWVTAIIQGRWVQAKVYNEPSHFGYKGGRVSKLCISKTDSRDPNRNYFDQMCYGYDRGSVSGNAPTELVDKIVEELEALPQLEL